ncbi:helix-turn-helix domain-containing protein [Roseibium sp.]|uniref:helix-turn-helix domain-containing protein n=1 Tax=Roseibium sp. TaxID=1936156 RepID=UPI003B50C447
MIVPSPDHGLPEPIAHASTADIYAAVTKATAFEARIDPVRCVLLIPLASGDMTIVERGQGAVGRVRRAFCLSYLPSGRTRNARQSAAIEHIYISVTANRAAKLLSQCGSKKWRLPDLVVEHRHGDIALIAQTIRRHLFEPSCPNTTFLSAATDLLLSHAIGASTNMSANDQMTVFTNGTLRSVLSEIDAQIEDGVRVAALAKRFDMTPSAFSRKFRASIGCTPQRYVIERRIGRARELLKDSDLPISEIAYALGFSSQAHLTSSFKEVLGVTPGRYRDSFTADRTKTSKER